MVVPLGRRVISRLRGSGWLTCPQCGEHAAQDVIDDVAYISVLGLRLTPVGRRRVLLCRRCDYRRIASLSELTALNTAGQSIRRGALIPTGLIGLAVLAGAIAFLVRPQDTGGQPQIHFVAVSGGQVAPVRFEVPSTWNLETFSDTDPPYIKASFSGNGDLGVTVRRIGNTTDLGSVILAHFADESGLEASGFPTVPPAATCTRLGDLPAARVKIDFRLGDQAATVTMYTLVHEGVAYTVSFTASGSDAMKLMADVSRQVLATFSFVRDEPRTTPEAATPSAVAGPTPTLAVSCT